MAGRIPDGIPNLEKSLAIFSSLKNTFHMIQKFHSEICTPPKIKTYVHTKAWIWTGSHHAVILAVVDLVHTIVKFPSRNTHHFLVYRHDNFMHHLHCFYYFLSVFFFFLNIQSDLHRTWVLHECYLNKVWVVYEHAVQQYDRVINEENWPCYE